MVEEQIPQEKQISTEKISKPNWTAWIAAVFINGVKVEGAQPFSILKDLNEQTQKQALNGNLETQNR